MTWPADVEALKPGDECEYRYPARNLWRRATVVHNGGSGYWRVHNREAGEVDGIYIEHVRVVGDPEAQPKAPERTCVAGPEGCDPRGGEMVCCAVCGEPVCDYHGRNEHDEPDGDWLCPQH